MKLLNKKKGNKKTKKRISKDTKIVSQKGYEFSPSFIKTGNYYATIVKVTNNYGTNRYHSYGWLTSILPEITVPGVKAWVFEADKPVSADEQHEIMQENVSGKLETYDQGGTKKKEDSKDREIKSFYREDLQRTQILDGKGEPIIEYKLQIMLVGKSIKAISQQLDKLQGLLNEDLKGVELDSIGGQQKELFKTLLQAPRKSKNDYTAMGSDFAGNDHIVRQGFEDPEGIAIGNLSTSFARGAAFMDLDTSFNPMELDYRKDNIKGETGNIFIAAHKTSRIRRYSSKNTASSLWGQLIANHSMVSGHRTFHIVMNGFKYEGSSEEYKEFYAEPSLNEVIKYMDLSKGGINPMQMYGNPKDTIEIFNNGKDRLAYMFYLLSGRKISETIQNDLKKALTNFYINNKLWVIDGHKHPQMLRLLEMDNPKNFPTSAKFINTLTSTMLQVVNSDKYTEEHKTRIADLTTTLENALDGHAELFNAFSTVPKKIDKKYFQYYYDLSGLKSESTMMEVTLVNTFDYVSSLASPGDVIMFHGLDKISVETLDFMSKHIDSLKEKDIRFAYLFDTIGSNTIKAKNNKEDLKLADIYNTLGVLYNNITTDFDFNILGVMTSDEVELYEKTLSEKQLPIHLKTYLTRTSRSTQYQIRRKKDVASFLINADFII